MDQSPIIYSENKYFDYLEFLEKGSSFIKRITLHKRRLNSSKFSSRIANHWCSYGLIDDNRENKKGWHSFSVTEFIWFNIIGHLREFGCPNDKILNVKNALLKNPYDEHDSINTCSLLHYHIALAFQKKKSFIQVYEDGTAFLLTTNNKMYSEMILGSANFIQISINHILGNIFPKKDFKTKREIFSKLSQSENDLLFEIRVNKPDKVSAKINDGEITHIDVEETITENDSFSSILKEHGYQDLSVKLREDKIVSIKRNKKYKVTKK